MTDGTNAGHRLVRGICVLLASSALAGSGVSSTAGAETPAEGASAEGVVNPAAEGDSKFGLTLAQRKAAFLELADAERRAEREAESAETDPPESMEEVDLAQRLALEYKDAVAQKYGLTREQAVELSGEGVAGEWPVE